METREAPMGEPQPRTRDMAYERLQPRPLDKPRVVAHLTTEATRHPPSPPCGDARVDPPHAPDPSVADQLDLPRDHESRRLHVDQAVIEHVRAQQHLPRTALELRQ